MGVFAMGRSRRRLLPEHDTPISRGLLMGMLVLVGVLGYLVHSETELQSWVLLGGGAVGGLALLLAALQRPDLPLYVMVIYLPFSKLLTGDFGGIMMALNLTNLLLMVIVVSWFASSASEGMPRFEPNILHLPVLLFALWGLLSFVVKSSTSGSYFIRHVAELKRWLDPIVIYFLFFHLVKDRRRWKTIVVLVMVGVTIAALLAVHDYMGVREGTSLEKSRVGGIAGQPNILGAFFVYYMFLFAGFWLERMNRPKAWWLLAPFLLCFRGIMVTFSRGAYLAFAQGLMGLAFFKNKALFVLACLGIGFALLNPWILPEGIRYRLETTFKDQNQLASPYATGIEDLQQELDPSAGLRLVIWQGAMDMIKERPWLGVGLGRFQREIMEYAPLDRPRDAHNAYLITAAELGVPALAFFLITVLMMFRITRTVYRRHADPFIRTTALGFLGGLSGLLMANMFGSRMNTSEVSGYFWILAALMARAHLWTREEMAKERLAQATERQQHVRAGRSSRRRSG